MLFLWNTIHTAQPEGRNYEKLSEENTWGLLYLLTEDFDKTNPGDRPCCTENDLECIEHWTVYITQCDIHECSSVPSEKYHHHVLYTDFYRPLCHYLICL